MQAAPIKLSRVRCHLTSSAPGVTQNTAYTYDRAGRLTSITPPGGTATTFTFDALGRHATRVTPGPVTDTYEYVGTSQTVWRITSGSVVTSSGIDPGGARVATKTGGTTLGFTLADLHANLPGLTNSAETSILSAVRYDPFGQTIGTPYDSGGSFPTPWKFQGRLDVSPDASDSLYATGARFYSPGIGVFSQLDSYGGSAADPLSLNRYLYAEANPWTLIDPDGHRGCLDTGATCETTNETDQQWEQNKQQAQQQENLAQQLDAYGCHRTGECSTPDYSTPDYSNVVPVGGGPSYQVLPPGNVTGSSVGLCGGGGVGAVRYQSVQFCGVFAGGKIAVTATSGEGYTLGLWADVTAGPMFGNAGDPKYLGGRFDTWGFGAGEGAGGGVEFATGAPDRNGVSIKTMSPYVSGNLPGTLIQAQWGTSNTWVSPSFDVFQFLDDLFGNQQH